MKLITKEMAPKLMAAYEHSAETGEGGKEIIAKFFTPWAGATWFITGGMPVDEHGEPTTLDAAKDWHLFGWADLGDPSMAELGYVMLSDLTGLSGPFGLKVERYLAYSGELADVVPWMEKEPEPEPEFPDVGGQSFAERFIAAEG